MIFWDFLGYLGFFTESVWDFQSKLLTFHHRQRYCIHKWWTEECTHCKEVFRTRSHANCWSSIDERTVPGRTISFVFCQIVKSSGTTLSLIFYKWVLFHSFIGFGPPIVHSLYIVKSPTIPTSRTKVGRDWLNFWSLVKVEDRL